WYRPVSVPSDRPGAWRGHSRPDRSGERHHVSDKPSGGGRGMTKTTLLLVDDDEDIRTQMKWALAADYDVVMAGDRAGALAAFKTSHPTVTLLDLGLPPRPNEPEEGLRSEERRAGRGW